MNVSPSIIFLTKPLLARIHQNCQAAFTITNPFMPAVAIVGHKYLSVQRSFWKVFEGKMVPIEII